MAIICDDFAIATAKRACRTTHTAATLSLLRIPVAALPAARILTGAFDVPEPDTLAINWAVSCQNGTRSLSNWCFDPKDTATWTGTCPSGRRERCDILRQYRHGRPVDRFEVVSRLGNRESISCYDWRAGRWYWGAYHWRRDCLRYDEVRIAIGVALGPDGSQ